MPADGVWIFGYGSLVWRPDFPWSERRAGRLRGWRRAFWQGSTDHRGVPGAPGRVATLFREPAAVTFGVAYRVPAEACDDVLSRLDVREQGGFERHAVRVELASGEIEALVYVAGPGNPNYLGPAPLEAIAAQVRRSSGPSGANVEYVLRLAETLRELGGDDPHVFELERLVRASS